MNYFDHSIPDPIPEPEGVEPAPFHPLDYLDDETAGLSPEQVLSVHYRLVGAASVWLDEARWRSVVDNAVSAVKGARL